MDFKSLVSKINSLNDPVHSVAAPTLPSAPILNEDAQIKVLAGLMSITEAKKKAEEKKEEKKEEKVKEEKIQASGVRASDSKKGKIEKSSKKQYFVKLEKEGSSKGVTMTADEGESMSQVKDRAARDYRSQGYTVSSIREKGDVDESSKLEFRSKFLKMVEENKEESSEEKKKKEEKKKEEKKKRIAKIMDEAKKPDDDGDGVPDWADKKPGKDDNANNESKKKGMTAKQEKYFGKKNESKMMPKGKKRPVKESVEQKLTFKQMVQLVQESGGQQQIDAVDTELFNWAQRVARNKLGEGMKAEIYAGLIYERNGGVFQMYDVLSEEQK